MNFKIKLFMRNWYLNISFWLLSFSVSLVAFAVIKYQKFKEFTGFMYPNANLDSSHDIGLITNHYLKSELLPILKWILPAILLDIVIRKVFKKK